MGAKSEWKHNKKGFVVKTAVVLGATAALVALVRSRRGSEPSTRDYERYDEAMGDLGDADGAPSIGGPAV
jgi:hypothetical protein